MKLTLIKDGPEVLEISCEGKILDTDFFATGGANLPDPLADLIGPEGFGRKAMLDLSGVTFLASLAVGWLIRCNKNFRESGGQFVVHSAPDFIDQTFRLSFLYDVMSIVPDEGTAREYLARSGR